MTNQDVLKVAMAQSAIDANCRPSDFMRSENVIVPSEKNANARKYLALPFVCHLISYGNNIVASVDMKYADTVSAYINAYSVEKCFETPNMQVLNGAFEKHDMQVCFMAEYFLPDLTLLSPKPCKYELRTLEQKDFAPLYRPEWSNALCVERKELDVLGVGAFFENRLIGLAACSADCDEMWQIGVDVLPEFRRQGIASAMTANLACKIVERGKVPFYCCAWANIKSARNAIKSGFRPAWAEMTVKPKEYVDWMNQIG